MATKTKQEIGRSSKRKGKNGELEVANLLKKFGYNARRSSQYCGNTGDAPDVRVEGLPLHIEVKRTERFSWKYYTQAVNDSKASGETPVIFYRRSYAPWMVILSAEDFLQLMKKRRDDDK